MYFCKIYSCFIDDDKSGLRSNVNTMSFDNPRNAIVKRGKVNLSQHEKITDPFGSSHMLSKDPHNVSNSFEKG